MIIDLPDTTTSDDRPSAVDLRESGGAVALGRVLTLILVTEDARAESAIRAANDASREHPCRVIAVVRGERARTQPAGRADPGRRRRRGQRGDRAAPVRSR